MDPQTVKLITLLFLLFGLPWAIYEGAKTLMYIHDLERAVKSSPDAQHFLRELAKDRKAAADEFARRVDPYGVERCEHCHWWKGLMVNDQGMSERKCINSKCPGPKKET